MGAAVLSSTAYAARLQELCQLRGLDSPVYQHFTSEKEGPDQTRLLSATVTVKGLTFPTPWLWCKSPDEAHHCAAKLALHFFTATSSTETDVPDVHMYKGKLQEYTQKMSLQLPIYHTVKEGLECKTKYRCTVTVNNTPYTSPQMFTRIKSAEQDAARIALESLQDPTNEILPIDIAFCKTILLDYALEMHFDKPSYQTTVQAEGSLLVSECTVHFNGAYYRGVKGKYKEEAEQKAAHFVIQIILDMGAPDSESVKVMSGIIWSKFKLYSAVSNTNSNFSGIVNTRNAVKEQPAYLPLLNNPKLEVPSQAVVPGVEFVPSGSVHGSVAPPSGSKRKRKREKKAKGNRQTQQEQTAVPGMIAGATQVSLAIAQ